MDSKKIIKKYIMPNSLVRICAVVFGAVMVVTLFMGITALNAEVPDPVDFYPSETPVGTSAYIDVVGVSNWLYQYDEAIYYSVEDAYGYLYTVRLKDSQLKEMAAQEEYWNRTSETAPMPEPYRLVGVVQEASASVKESLAQAWGISESEYVEYFGVNFLNATTSVGAENSSVWFIGAFGSFLVTLLCLVFQLQAAIVSKKCLKELEERCLMDKAAQQLSFAENHFVVGKNRGILTQDFIFGKGTGAVVPFSDVVWAYKLDQRRNFAIASSYLMVGTPWMGAERIIDLNQADKYGYISDTLAMIAEKNPNAMLGYTKENRRAYNAVKAGK